MSWTGVHDDWLSLIEISGPFLAIPVLKEAFPQGLDELDGLKRKRLRQAYEEWREALDTDDRQFAELHLAWIDEVLSRGLELDEDGSGDALKYGDQLPDSLRVTLPEHGVTITPDFAVVDSSQDNKPLMLIQTYAVDVDLDAATTQHGWVASPAERMVQLCRMTGCRIGLVTNGERWMLVDAPVGAVTTFASWYARIWNQEPITLQAFVHLLGIRRFFYDQSEQLPALFDRSLQYQDEVTDALGVQVRRAVEVLIQALDKADLDRNRELLHGVAPTVLYEAGLTVMMRLVFLLSAEERGLFLLGDERYEANYAISTLRLQLRTVSEEILERRWDAWSRLLAIFRAVFGGIEHENLRLPALGGSLFDPDRFPFLEGRATGTNWRTDSAKPLPIDNRTVLLLLEAIQQFQGRTLSYRALDVEQIGYVYEGLLERTVKRTDEVTLELDATKSAKMPWVKLGELESAKLDGVDRLTKLLIERTGSSASRIRNDLAKPVDDILADKLLTACQGDTNLRNRIKSYAYLLRTDPWGYPLVYPKGAFIVTTGSDRRETGAHYTPKSLTEAIVVETLTPVVYTGPAEGKSKVNWVLKSSAELLNLKICDPAMGSGAFLVQVCRWLAERLVESWSYAESSGKYVTIDGVVCDTASGEETLPRDVEERTIIARRLIAERCLYGVDLNSLAVELAKLSIWLVTMAKGRPFGFLDHNLRCGDSLLGIHQLDQLTELTMTPGNATNSQMSVFDYNIEQAVHEAVDLRQQLRKIPIRDINDIEVMAQLDNAARIRLEVSECIADALIGEVFRTGNNEVALKKFMPWLADHANRAIRGDQDAIKELADCCSSSLSIELSENIFSRKPFHWPVEFPEVFGLDRDGFDAIVANPPFLGGSKITGSLGTAYRNYLVQTIAKRQKGTADLSAYFFLRVGSILRENGMAGLLATNTIAQGSTREVGLDQLASLGLVFPRANSSRPWPGSASLEVAHVWLRKGAWGGEFILNDEPVIGITSYLAVPGRVQGKPFKLIANAEKSYVGSVVIGMGFLLTQEEAGTLIKADSKNADCLYPYLNGEDINSRFDQAPSRWVINFQNWPLNRNAVGQWAIASDKHKKDWFRNGVVPADYPGPVAADYPDLLLILEEKVKPERAKVKRAVYRDRWWNFAERQSALYTKLSKLNRVFVHPFTSKHHSLVAYEPGIVFSHMTVVLLFKSWKYYSVLQSEIHWKWALKYGNKLENRPQYSPSDCFETFPFPLEVNELDVIGERFYFARQKTMRVREEGLTKIYNRFHNPDDVATDIIELRHLSQELDRAVAGAYGWHDINLGHGFYETNQGLRYTISEEVHLDILDRLLELNHQRHEEEVADGLHDKSTNKAKSTRTSQSKASSQNTFQNSLFDLTVQPIESLALSPSFKIGNDSETNTTNQILAWLEAHEGWFQKSTILNGCGVSHDEWHNSINDLLTNKSVERQGETHSARYRYAGGGK